MSLEVPAAQVAWQALRTHTDAALALVKARPLVAAVVFATVKGVLADALAQMLVEGRSLRRASRATLDDGKAYDWKRTAALATFSGMYCGGFFYWQFSILFPRIWPVVAGKAHSWWSVISQVAVDNFLFSTCLYCPVFYVTKGLICNQESPSSSLARYRQEFSVVVETLLTVWVPAGLINFSLMPVWGRTPFNAVVSFFYLTILSVQSARLAREAS